MILIQTPYRVSLFGGGTDYPEWFEKHGGFCLGMAINQYCYVALKPLPPVYGDAFRYRIVYAKVEDRQTIAEIEHPAVRGVLTYFGINSRQPLEIAHMGDLPARGGLGASSAFVVGLINAMKNLIFSPEYHDERSLAIDAIHVERDIIKEAVGYQDQIMTAMGGLRTISFAPQPAHQLWNTKALALSPTRQAELEASLVLVFTGALRDAHVMAAKQIIAIPDNDTTLESMQFLAQEAYRVLLSEKTPLHQIGTMLDATWRLKRELCDGITSPVIDDLYYRGISLGAMGGKLLGAGGGGFMLFFVPPSKRERFETQIGAPCVSFKISATGTRRIPL